MSGSLVASFATLSIAIFHSVLAMQAATSNVNPGAVRCMNSAPLVPRFSYANRVQTVLNLQDCYTALGMIPDGRLFADLDPNKLGTPERFNLYRSPAPPKSDPVHQRKFFLPAAFHSGSCIILVAATGRNLPYRGSSNMMFRDYYKNQPEGPTEAALSMHTKLWPDVKSVAKRIIEYCELLTEHQNMGVKEATTMLGKDEKYEFNYRVIVGGLPRVHNNDWPRDIKRGNPVPFGPDDGWKVRFDMGPYGHDNFYNFYTAGGTFSGKATRGLYDWTRNHVSGPDYMWLFKKELTSDLPGCLPGGIRRTRPG